MLTKNVFVLMFICLVMASCTKEDVTPTKTPVIHSPTTDAAELRSPSTHCTTNVYDAATNAVTGTATLVRTNKKISMTFQANNLTPGNAYTIWWVIWNKPENCAVPYACQESDFATTQLVEVDAPFAVGHVVGNSGVGHFAASRKEGDLSGSTNYLFNEPAFALEDARTAEIHLVLRDHGPVIPGRLKEQIGTYLGGCDVNTCTQPMFAIFSPTCGQ